MIPTPPKTDPSSRALGLVPLRFEDVAPDGRCHLGVMPASLGAVLWRHALETQPWIPALRELGVIPVLSRLAVEGDDTTIGPQRPLAGEGCFELAHTASPEGAVERLLLLLWTSLSAAPSLTYGPPPPPDSPRSPVGRVYAEHVFTRPFADASQRRVQRFEVEGIDPVPARRIAWRPPAHTAMLPSGASALEDPSPDTQPHRFGLMHSDANRHVNSLVYPRLFEEAFLRRLAERGVATEGLLARRWEAAWRKPCFAGEVMVWVLQRYALDGREGAVGWLVPAGDTSAAPHCWMRMELG